MYFLQNHWGDIFSVTGLIVSSGGLIWVIWEARRARRAAESAEDIVRGATDRIARVLGVADLQRAVDLIQRLKDYHQQGRWEAAREWYQPLRFMISDIELRYPDLDSSTRDRLDEYKVHITWIGRHVAKGLRNKNEIDWEAINDYLDKIQETLEHWVSAAGFVSD